MFRAILILTAVTASAPALATVQFQNFMWKADSTIEVQILHNNAPKILKGDLRDGQSRALTVDGVSVTVNSLSNSFVTIAFTEGGQDSGGLIVLERQNSIYVPLTAMIPGRASTLVADLDGALGGLKKINRWDHSIALRSMASYFSAYPDKTLNDFYDAVELGHVKMIARPLPRTEPSKSARRAPAAVAMAPTETEVRPEPKRRQPKIEQPWRTTEEPTPPRERRVPLPYEPRYSPNTTMYPGQNMRPREYTPPPRRKTIFDLFSGN